MQQSNDFMFELFKNRGCLPDNIIYFYRKSLAKIVYDKFYKLFLDKLINSRRVRYLEEEVKDFNETYELMRQIPKYRIRCLIVEIIRFFFELSPPNEREIFLETDVMIGDESALDDGTLRDYYIEIDLGEIGDIFDATFFEQNLKIFNYFDTLVLLLSWISIIYNIVYFYNFFTGETGDL